MDATQDLFIRGIGPPLAAALVLFGAGAATACLLILVPCGLLALGLLLAGVAVPAVAVAALAGRPGSPPRPGASWPRP